MEIKPIKSIKPVSQSEVGPDTDIVNKPKVPTPKNSEDINYSSDISLSQRALIFQGKDMKKVITEMAIQNPQALAQIANELEKFKKTTLRKKQVQYKKNPKLIEKDEELELIYSLCSAHIMRITQLIKKRYDQTKDGLMVFFDEEGQLILNGINVHALIKQSRENATPKSKIFLKGIKTRLGYIVHNRSNNPYYIQIRDVVLELIDQIEDMIS